MTPNLSGPLLPEVVHFKTLFEVKMYFSYEVLSLDVLKRSLVLSSLHSPFWYLCKLIWSTLSLLFSRLSNPRCLSLYERCSDFLIVFVALCWTNCSSSMPLLCWRTQKMVQKSRCLSPVLSRGETQLSLFSDNTFLVQPRRFWPFFLQGHTRWPSAKVTSG